MKLDSILPGAPALEVTGISADSRKVKPGYLFAAMQGVAEDGAQVYRQGDRGGRRGCAHRHAGG